MTFTIWQLVAACYVSATAIYLVYQGPEIVRDTRHISLSRKFCLAGLVAVWPLALVVAIVFDVAKTFGLKRQLRHELQRAQEKR